MAQVNIDVAKEESVQAVNTKVGTSSDTASSTPTTLFAGIKGLIAWFTGTWTAVRAGYVDNINSNTATNNTASKTGTLSQKGSYGISLLENATFGLSALKTTITGGGSPVVKSVQNLAIFTYYASGSYYSETIGGISSKYVDITIPSVDINKTLIYFQPYNLGYGYGAKLINSTTIRIYTNHIMSNSSLEVNFRAQIVEFY